MTIAELYDSLQTPYDEKQRHPVPDFPVVDRVGFILDMCRGKVVLDIGASGPMHEAIVEVAKKCYGIDREPGPNIVAFDLDNIGSFTWTAIPWWDDVEIIVCGEVIEHLANPGNFLQSLRHEYFQRRATKAKPAVIITVPNAASSALQASLRQGIESVNSDHVAWYSWKTLSVLLGRYGYEPMFWGWYNGSPRFAEGIVCVTE